ncbi:MAG TPA: hypothetical protein VK609_01865 [Mucilaginibacter sp.]|nr:hypothetical protein [Mucilaginibacter sp.]
MEQFIGEDPDVAKHYVPSYKMPTEHLFAAIPATGTKVVMVRVTERFYTVYEEKINLS